jgi:hypothetical protein
MRDRARQTWIEAEPKRAAREREAMAEVAPEMAWLDGEPAGGWQGLAPKWPINRPEPLGLDNFLGGQRLRVHVEYSQGYPMVAPTLIPLDPEPPVERRIVHAWHVNGDGSLCLLQTADQWTGRETAAELVAKASGWFIGYLLFDRGAITTMTECGLHVDTSLDELINEWARK